MEFPAGPSSAVIDEADNRLPEVVPQKRKNVFKSACQPNEAGSAEQLAAIPFIVSQKPVKKTSRISSSWSDDETAAFFDAVKQYGKNFDEIVKNWSRKRKGQEQTKVKERVRNFYFNKLKRYKANAGISEDEFTDIPRDARELFILINGFEWSRKVGKGIDPVMFRRLLIEGIASLRMGLRKQLVTIRTPNCPSLQKFFRGQSSKIGSTYISLYLIPKLQCDRMYVESCSQNPYVKIRIAGNEYLSRVFEILKAKWTRRLNRIDASKNFTLTNLLLFPSESTPVKKVQVKAASDTSSMIFSFARLRKEMNYLGSVCTDGEQDEHRMDEALYSVRSMNQFTSPFDGSSPSRVSNLVLNESLLRNGLSECNSANVTVTELSYLYEMKTNISLLYSTNIDAEEFAAPWKTFMTLLLNQMEVSQQSAEDVFSEKNGERNLPKSSCSSLQNMSVKPIYTFDHSNVDAVKCSIPDVDGCKNPKFVSRHTASTYSSPLTSAIVEEENNAFVKQLESLTGMRMKQAVLPDFYRNEVKQRSTPQESEHSLEAHEDFTRWARNAVSNQTAPLKDCPTINEARNPQSLMHNTHSKRDPSEHSSPLKSNSGLPEDVQQCLNAMSESGNSREFLYQFNFFRNDWIDDLNGSQSAQ